MENRREDSRPSAQGDYDHRSRDGGARSSDFFQEDCQKAGILWEICALLLLNAGDELKTENTTCLQTLSGRLDQHVVTFTLFLPALLHSSRASSRGCLLLT